jgi:hypothetical protein
MHACVLHTYLAISKHLVSCRLHRRAAGESLAFFLLFFRLSLFFLVADDISFCRPTTLRLVSSKATSTEQTRGEHGEKQASQPFHRLKQSKAGRKRIASCLQKDIPSHPARGNSGRLTYARTHAFLGPAYLKGTRSVSRGQRATLVLGECGLFAPPPPDKHRRAALPLRCANNSSSLARPKPISEAQQFN